MVRVTRTFDVDVVKAATDPYADGLIGFRPEEWLEDHKNVALCTDSGDVALFERTLPWLVTGHYFYFSRGKAAIEVSNAMLNEIFSDYGVEVVQGLVPIENPKAIWISRKIGFTSHGVLDTFAGPCNLLILTKPEHNKRLTDNG